MKEVKYSTVAFNAGTVESSCSQLYIRLYGWNSWRITESIFCIYESMLAAIHRHVLLLTTSYLHNFCHLPLKRNPRSTNKRTIHCYWNTCADTSHYHWHIHRCLKQSETTSAFCLTAIRYLVQYWQYSLHQPLRRPLQWVRKSDEITRHTAY